MPAPRRDGDGDRRPPAVVCTGLVKRYGHLVAVNGLDLEVRTGECFGLLGPNGAGKTTAIEVLEGLLAPDEGQVRILGQTWTENPAGLRARLGIHLQESQLDEKLSVAETLRLFRALYPSGWSVDHVLGMLELGSKRSSRVGTLSGGQCQRLAIGCALIGQPEMLFLDEPTTGLDPQSRRQLWLMLEHFRDGGGTILLTTHYMDEAHVLCDRIAIVDHGRVIARGTPDDLIASIGTSHIVRLSFGAPDADASEIARRLAGLPDIESVRVETDGWRLTATALHQLVPAVVELAAELETELTGLYTRTATLEDVFVTLTGRHLRDE